MLPTVEFKREFGRRLQHYMIRRGWNQSELARRATEQLPRASRGQERKSIGRDMISNYIRGTMLPKQEYLKAIADALNIAPAQLHAPQESIAADGSLRLVMQSAGNGRMLVQLNCIVSKETATKIEEILREEDKP